MTTRLRDKPFKDALRKAVARTDGDVRRLDKIAIALVAKACLGDVHAIKEIADRLDGRVPYKMGGDDKGEPLSIIITGVPRPGRDE
jgi:hypothetical protein